MRIPLSVIKHLLMITKLSHNFFFSLTLSLRSLRFYLIYEWHTTVGRTPRSDIRCDSIKNQNTEQITSPHNRLTRMTETKIGGGEVKHKMLTDCGGGGGGGNGSDGSIQYFLALFLCQREKKNQLCACGKSADKINAIRINL